MHRGFEGSLMGDIVKSQVVLVKRLNSKAILPERMSSGAAGWDLFACLSDPLTILPQQRALVPTGLAFELPEGFEAQVRPRSGLALKHGVTVLNSPGTIDSDYRGEIRVILVNLGEQPFKVSHGMRIAQVVFSQVAPVRLRESAHLSETKRSSGGFGHTGE